MKTFKFEIQCPSRDRGLCSGNLLLVDREGVCVHAQLQSRDFYLTDDIVGKNIFDLFPRSASVPLKAGFLSVSDGTRKGSCHEDLYECTGYGGQLSVYYLMSMNRYDENLIMIRLRNISHYINKHERLLRQEERKVEDLKRMAGIGVWRYNSVTQQIESKGYADPVFHADAYGIMDREKYFSLMSAADAVRVAEFIRMLDAGQRQGNIEYVLRWEGRDVVLRVVPISCQPCDGGYLWEGYVQNVTDLTIGRTQVEMLEQAIDSVSEEVFAAETDGSLVFANKTFRERNMPGNPSKDVIREKIFDLNGNSVNRDQWTDWVKNIRQNGGTWDFTWEHALEGDPVPMTMENYSYLMKNELHQELIWVFARDISERLKREEEINSLQYLMNSIINNIPVGLYVKDVAEDFNYLFCNRAASDFLQPGDEEVIGRNDFQLFRQAKAAGIRAGDERLVESKARLEQLGQVRNASGETVTYEEIRIYSEKKDGSPLIIGMAWDITARVELEKALMDAKEKAEEAGRLKSAFLANMSHEIRTPLNAIVGFSNIIAETQDLDERRGMYKIVETNNERLLSLINEILDLSKIEAGMLELSFKPVNLQVLCNEVLNAHMFRCPGNVIFSFDASSPNLVTTTDPNRLFQVFANLITNAFKFTDSGCVTFGYELSGQDIVCRVQDSGIGIEADKLDKIFDRFVKVNDFAQGTGLGLPICRVLIEKMGGHIDVSSEIGKGTTFTFVIPYTPPVNEKSAGGKSGGVRNGKSVDTVTVLVAEDGSSNFDRLCEAFGDEFFFIQAHSGVEAVTMFEQYRPDLVFLDVCTQDMDGLEVVGIMKEVSPETPVIALNAADDRRERERLREGLCDDFMDVVWSVDFVRMMASKYLI